VWKLIGPLISVHRLVLFFPETGKQGQAELLGVRLQEHRQEVTQHDVRAYPRSTSRSAATEQNKSAVTDHANSLDHVVNWDRATVIDRESIRLTRWIRKAVHIKKEQDKSMNRNEGFYQLPHIYDCLLSATATPGKQSFQKGNSGSRNVNNKF